MDKIIKTFVIFFLFVGLNLPAFSKTETQGNDFLYSQEYLVKSIQKTTSITIANHNRNRSCKLSQMMV